MQNEITPTDLLLLLSTSYLNTLIIDLTSDASCLLPASKNIMTLSHKYTIKNKILNGNGSCNGFTSPNTNKIDSHFCDLLYTGNVVVYDEDGSQASKEASDHIRNEGKCLSSRYLLGGLSAWKLAYPNLIRGSSLPKAEQINDNMLGSLKGLEGPCPISNLIERQRKLVDTVWFGVEQPRRDPPVQVLPHLFLGSAFSASKAELASANISHVIRLGWGFFSDAKDGSVTFYDYPIEDSIREPIHHLFDETYEIINKVKQKGEKVLVHCYAGVSRSSTIVLAYLLKNENLSLMDAWNHLYKARPIIRPNASFAKALINLESNIRGTNFSSLPWFWMSQSYLYYTEYVEFFYRLSALPDSKHAKEDAEHTKEVFKNENDSIFLQIEE